MPLVRRPRFSADRGLRLRALEVRGAGPFNVGSTPLPALSFLAGNCRPRRGAARLARMGHNSGAPTYRRTYIRQWRAHRKMTLETLAERVGAKVGGMTHASLSRIERGLSPERLRGGTRAASIGYWLSMEESLRRHRGRRRHVGDLAISDVSISGAGHRHRPGRHACRHARFGHLDRRVRGEHSARGRRRLLHRHHGSLNGISSEPYQRGGRTKLVR